jgi:hypothetical protein
VDFSAQLARRFRRRFCELLTPERGGEARARLAEAALAICAEDDAVAAPTTVPFPIEHWLDRVARLTDGAEAAAAEAREQHRRTGTRRRSDDDAAGAEDAEEEERAAFAAIERFLYEQQGYAPDDDPSSRRASSPRAALLAASGAAPSSSPWWPRSALFPRRRYDHPGTAEQARRAYLHEALTRRKGTHPAALAVLLADVHARLLLRGATQRPAVVGDARRWTRAPTAAPAKHLTRRAAIPQAVEGDDDNNDEDRWPLAAFPAFDPLLELLRHLKRAYWPFLWDTNADTDREEKGSGSSADNAPPKTLSHGGFVGAAKAALGEDEDAALRVVSAAAKHRLERGIFTSPGAGDLRRCLAAAERAVLVLDARTATAADPRRHAADLALERRDLGVLLIHAGRAAEAAAELGAYAEARAAAAAVTAATASSRLSGVPRPWEAPPPERRAAAANKTPGWDTAFEAALADRLLAMAREAVHERPIPPPLTVRRALAQAERGDGGDPAAEAATTEPQRHTW